MPSLRPFPLEGPGPWGDEARHVPFYAKVGQDGRIALRDPITVLCR